MEKLLKILKFISFGIIFLFLWNIIFYVNGGGVLWLNKSPIYYYFKEPKNTMDVVYIGSSNVFIHYNPTLAFDLYGFTTGLLSSEAQPPYFIKSLIQASKDYQNPKLYIIDIGKIIDDLSVFNEGSFRGTLDSMPKNNYRKDMIRDYSHYINVSNKDLINYFWSFFLYHNRWKYLKEINFQYKDLYKGYLLDTKTIGIEKQDSYTWISQKKELNKENQEILDELLKYIQNNNLNVLFVVSKRVFIESDQMKINTVTDYIKNQNFDVINFNTLDDFELDFSHDLYNYAHINVYGSTKFTLYFSKYIKNKYELLDHRDDKKFSSWKKEYIRFKESFKKLTNQDFDLVLKEYNRY